MWAFNAITNATMAITGLARTRSTSSTTSGIARPPGWMSHDNATLPGESRVASLRILWAARSEQIEPERVAFGSGIAEADGVDSADHAAVALEQAVCDRDDA